MDYTTYGYENKHACYKRIAEDYGINISFVYSIASRYSEEYPDIFDIKDAIERRLGIQRMEEE